MSQINVLGPVGFNSTGNYDNTKQYERLDVVYYEGSSYVAIQNSIGQLPTNTTYWDKIAEKGDTGNGISSITKTSTSGLVDTYTITFTNGQTTTYEITNGENGSVVDVQVDGTSVVDNGVASIDGLTEMKQELEDMYNLLPKVQGTGNIILLNGTVAGKMVIGLLGNTNQDAGTIKTTTGDNTIKVEGKNLFNKNNATVKSMSTGSTTAGNTGTFGSASKQKHVYITCQPSTTYTVTKDISNNRVLGVYETTEEPAVGKSFKALFFSSTSNGKATVTTSENVKFLDVRINTDTINADTQNSILSSIQIEKNSEQTPYRSYTSNTYSFNLGSIELCKVETYQDYIYKSSGNWYKHGAVDKISSYNGETITTDYISSTGSLTTGATVYYGLTTPTDTQITDNTLIGQLETIMRSFDEQTNISQTNDGAPFILDVTALKAFTE